MAHKHPVYDTDKHFVIDPITKKISTESPKLVLAQHSHNSERFTFEIPKMVEGHDMSLCNLVEVHYQNIEAVNKSNKFESYCLLEDLQAGTSENEDVVFCSWLIPGDATQFAGGLIFALRFACIADDGTVEYNYPTLIYSSITVGESIWNSGTIAEKYPEILEQFDTRLALLETGYYIPSISQTEPNTVEISFTASKEGMAEVKPKTFTIPPGAKGDTPVKGVDYWTEEDQQQILSEVQVLTDTEIDMLNTLLMEGSPVCAPTITEAKYNAYSTTSPTTHTTTYYWSVWATITDIAKALVQKVEVGRYTQHASQSNNYSPPVEWYEVEPTLGDTTHGVYRNFSKSSSMGGWGQYGFAVRLTYWDVFGETKTIHKSAVKTS